MEHLFRLGSLSQESQVGLLPAADVKPSQSPFQCSLGAPLKGNCRRLELDEVSLNPRDRRGPSVSSQDLPSYAASIHRQMTWWSWHSAWSMYAFLLLGIGFATGHHFYYASLDGEPEREQTQKLRYGTFLAFLTKASLIWAVVAALRQRIFTTLQSKSLSPQGVDSLLAIADDPLAVLDWRTMLKGKTAVLMAAIAWLGPVMVILASQALSVEPTSDVAQCPGIRTLNFSHEALEEWREPTTYPDGRWCHSVSQWNITSPDNSSPELFDYWHAPSETMKDVARMAVVQQQVIYSSSASQTACGPEWDCRYNISFIGPGYKCAPVNTRPSPNRNTTGTAVPPFDESVLIPRGNYSYHAYATAGEYSSTQMENVSAGGVPLGSPPFPQTLGAFRTEPVVWIGRSAMVGSGPIPPNRTFPDWNDYFTARVYRCDMFETRYTVEFSHYQGSQSTRILSREHMKPLINTTYDPKVAAIDGTHDNITAVPKDRYVYANRDKEHYRYVAAFHSIGYVFRDLINGTIDSRNVLTPTQTTRAVSSKLIQGGNGFMTVPDIMGAVQSVFEDVLLSMFSHPQFLAVSFAGDPSRITLEQEGDNTTMYPCIRSKLENRFRYRPLELGAVYGVSVILAAAAVAVGTVSVLQNGGVLKNTRFSSIATLLQHCGYSLDDYRQLTSRGDKVGGNLDG